jgi:FMN phosphatase YigB (HAD superfamily)
MIKNLILDLHGLIVKDFPVDIYIEKTKDILSRHGSNFEDAKKECMTISAFSQKYGFRNEYLSMMDSLPVGTTKEAELDSLLENCKMDVFLATDTSLLNAKSTLKNAGINPSRFKSMKSGNDIIEPKPNEEMFQAIMEENCLEPKECLAIGDRMTDAIPAIKLGIPTIVCDHDSFIEILKRMTGYEPKREDRKEA